MYKEVLLGFFCLGGLPIVMFVSYGPGGADALSLVIERMRSVFGVSILKDDSTFADCLDFDLGVGYSSTLLYHMSMTGCRCGLVRFRVMTNWFRGRVAVEFLVSCLIWIW